MSDIRKNIHPTSVIDSDVEIGEQTKIWHWVHVSSGAKIGRNVTIGQNAYIGKNVRIGDGCKIQNNVSVYEGVELAENVFCGPSAVFTNVYNPRASVNRKEEYRKTVVELGATLGANCTIVCGIKIGRYAFIGAGSVVVSNVKNYATVVGNPALQIGWMSEFGEKIPLPLSGSGFYLCPYSGVEYELRKDFLYSNASK